MAHRETWIHALHVRLRDEPRACLGGVLMTTAREHIERVLTAERLREQFCRENLFFAPDHAILQRRIDVMFSVQALMHRFDIVDEANQHVGRKASDQIEVERGEESVPPSKGGVRVNDDIGMLVRRKRVGEHILKRGAAQCRQTREREVKDATWPNILAFGVHHVAKIEELDRFALQRP